MTDERARQMKIGAMLARRIEDREDEQLRSPSSKDETAATATDDTKPETSPSSKDETAATATDETKPETSPS